MLPWLIPAPMGPWFVHLWPVRPRPVEPWLARRGTVVR
jgi:hypothetical protein